jgi:hypothetical protein
LRVEKEDFSAIKNLGIEVGGDDHKIMRPQPIASRQKSQAGLTVKFRLVG